MQRQLEKNEDWEEKLQVRKNRWYVEDWIKGHGED